MPIGGRHEKFTLYLRNSGQYSRVEHIPGADLHEQDRVLEIGTGSGYLTALMAQLAGMVHSVEDRASKVCGWEK